jgi:predicted deacylase
MAEIQLVERTFSGPHPGPRLLVTAGVHGDEFLPVVAVRELVRRFETDRRLRDGLRGSVTFLPLVNEAAFRLGRRVAEDGLDLARACPGRPDGSVTERVAHAVSARIREADAYVDLHTGGTELNVWPLAGYVLHRDADILARQRILARAFGLPFVWGTSAELPGRTLSVARDAGVPAIYVEYFGGVRERQEIASGAVTARDPDHPCVAGVLRVMDRLGMGVEPAGTEAECEVVEDARPDSGHMQIAHPAPLTGFLRWKAELGDRVSAGETLAEIETVDGAERAEVKAGESGRLVVIREFPRVNQGDAVAVIAAPHEG